MNKKFFLIISLILFSFVSFNFSNMLFALDDEDSMYMSDDSTTMDDSTMSDEDMGEDYIDEDITMDIEEEEPKEESDETMEYIEDIEVEEK